MKIVDFVIFLWLLMTFSVSCESTVDQAPSPSPIFHASIEALGAAGDQTKVYADSQLRVLWNADDRISVFNKRAYNQEYKFMGEDGDNAGNFEAVGTIGEGNSLPYIYAVYPHNVGTDISDDGRISITLPAEQTYLTHSFGRGINTMISVTQGNDMCFKNVGGYLALKLYGDDVSVSKITLQGNKSEKIAGNAEITIKVGETPSVVMKDSSTDIITLVCNPPVQLAAGSGDYTYFWFVIPPTSFSEGFAITVSDDQGRTYSKSTSNSLTVLRNYISSMAPLRIPSSFVSGDDSTQGTEIVDIIDGIW